MPIAPRAWPGGYFDITCGAEVMALEGDEKPKGMLDMNDISRKASKSLKTEG